MLAAFALSGGAALVYEVVWTRELSTILGSTVYAVSTMLAAFMAGLALGGYLGGKLADTSKDLLLTLGRLEFGIGVLGLISAPLIRLLPTAYFVTVNALDPPFWMFFLLQFVFSFALMLAPTTLMGATFPVVSKISVHSRTRLGRDIGSLYSANNVGAILGSLAAGFLLIPLLGVRGATITAAIANLAVAAAVMLASGHRDVHRFAASASIVVLLTGVAFVLPEHPGFSLGFYNLGRYSSAAEFNADRAASTVLYSSEGAYSRVSVVKHSSGVRTLHNGGMAEGSDGASDGGTTLVLAWLPYLASTQPRDAAVIGLGTGFTTRALLESRIHHVTTIEINPAVVGASRLFVGDLSGDQHWSLRISDARNELFLRRHAYDIITSEPSWPLSDSVNHLFTSEFFEIARGRLTSDGVFCQWLPAYLMGEDQLRMMYKTFAQVFPNTYVWEIGPPNAPATEYAFIGLKGDRRLDVESVSGSLRSKLAERGLTGVSVRPFADPGALARVVEDPTVDVNTDDRPLLEFGAVRMLLERVHQTIGRATPR